MARRKVLPADFALPATVAGMDVDIPSRHPDSHAYG
jgi:hypothetical protein